MLTFRNPSTPRSAHLIFYFAFLCAMMLLIVHNGIIFNLEEKLACARNITDFLINGTFQSGGLYTPSGCYTPSGSSIGIIIPLRGRKGQFQTFLDKVVPFLQLQIISFQILVVEQVDDLPFNRAALLNAGILLFESDPKLTDLKIECFIFHDVDHYPENSENIYECNAKSPVHFASAVDKNGYKMPYATYFGGVVAFSKEQFERIHGFSNCYWGWGGEDDDMLGRVQHFGMKVERKPEKIGRYQTYKHAVESANPARWDVLERKEQRYNTDGFRKLKFNVVEIESSSRYTKVRIDLSKQFADEKC